MQMQPSSFDSYLLSQLLQRVNLAGQAQAPDPGQDTSAQTANPNQTSSLGQDTSAQAPNPNEIVVSASRQLPPQAHQPSQPINYPDAPSVSLTNGPTAPDLGNRSYADSARAAVDNDRQPKSKLHSILDHIGDALLMSNGLSPMYKEEQDQKDLENAMAGFTANPMAAYERASTVDPAFAQKGFDSYQQNQYRNAQLQSLDADRKASIAKDHYLVVKDARITASRALTAAGNDPAKQQAAMSLIQRYAANNGVSMDELGLSPDMSQADRDVYSHTDMSGYQQNEIPMRQQTADAATENAAAHMKNASRPPRPVQPHSTTNVQTYVGDDGYQYTQRSDGSVVKSPTKVRPPTGRSNGRRSISPAPTSGWGPVTRN
jgi:hypothetical protein